MTVPFGGEEPLAEIVSTARHRPPWIAEPAAVVDTPPTGPPLSSGATSPRAVESRVSRGGATTRRQPRPSSRIGEDQCATQTAGSPVRDGADVIHNVHIHDVQFRVLAYGDRPPPPHLDGWKDTVFLPPGRTARLLVQFTEYADPTTPYMFHCHVLLHEDSGMMGQFVVVDAGPSAAVPSPGGHP